ncbi:MAG: NAD(P) transhydrogenase subunit alpha [Chitinophagaceae bacterium]
MIIGVLKEPAFENRVSMLPDSVTALIKKGVELRVERDAGLNAAAPNDSYTAVGATIHPRQEILRAANILLSIHPLPDEEIPFLHDTVLVGVYQPLFNTALMHTWAEANLTTFSLDMLPRTTRAQAMDVLSSQANIAGYKAAVLAANLLPRYFPMLMTAAGSIPPARVLILGAGVAGLQAIATSRRLGAVVEVFDTRPAVREEVMSLGGKFIEVEGAANAANGKGYAVEQSAAFLEKQRQKIADTMAKADVVITTAQIPGKKAPVLVSTDMISGMKPGSIIIDLAASTGGNTAVTENNKTIDYQGIKIIGQSNLPSEMPFDASRLYGKNVLNFLSLIIGKDGTLSVDFADDLIRGCCITNGGLVKQERLNTLPGQK